MSDDQAVLRGDTTETAAGGQPSADVPSDALIVVPVRDTVLFPGTVFPITIGRDLSIKAAQQALREQRPIGILMQRDAEIAEPLGVDLHRVGTVANILRYVNAPDGSHHLVLQGEQRFRVVEFTQERPFLVARVLRIEQPEELATAEVEARTIHLRRQAVEALELLPQIPQELVAAVQSAQSGGHLADLVAAYLDITPAEKQEIVETKCFG
jgi:ATP-dependent Lon protease